MFKPTLVLKDIDIFEGDLSFRVVLTGTRCVGSKVLTEDDNLLFHIFTSLRVFLITIGHGGEIARPYPHVLLLS